MKMLNGNLCCIALDQITETEKGIILPTKNKSYKRLKVHKSDVEQVAEGKTIYVPINCGNEVKIDDSDYVIVNVREIILILD